MSLLSVWRRRWKVRCSGSLRNRCKTPAGTAAATGFAIELAERDGQVCLDVRDWGVGFSLATVDEHHFGLQGIRERVRLLDGCVVIESAPGKGTRISVELPLVAAASDSSEDSV